MTRDRRDIDCGACALGRASGVGRGGFCPFIVRVSPPGATLCRAHTSGTYVWFIKSGTAVRHDPATPATPATGDRAVLGPGSFVGLECLQTRRYAATVTTPQGATLCGARSEGMHRWLIENRELASELLAGELSALSSMLPAAADAR